MNKQAGFTLIEIMVALLILGIIGVIISSGLNLVVRTENRMQDKYKVFADLQLALLMLERDIQQIVPRPITTENGIEKRPLLLTATAMELTRGGYINPFLETRSSLQRVLYQFSNHKLLRFTWDTLDRTPGTQPEEEVLLQDVQSLSFRYVPDNNFIVSPQRGGRAGIQIDITVAGVGNVQRIIPLTITSFIGA